MKTVLLPTNFSAKSHNAASYALELFRGEAVNFMMLNAYDLANYPTEIRLNALQGNLGGQSKKSLLAFAQQLSGSYRPSSLSDATFTTYAEFGKPARVISDFVKNRPIDYMVMGMEKQQRNLKKLFRSCHTRKIIQQVDCAVIVVPQQLKYKRPERITVLTQLQSPIQENRLLPLQAISEKFRPSVTVLDIGGKLSPALQAQQQLRFQRTLGASCSYISLAENHTEAALKYYLHQDETDLLIVDNSANFTKQLFLNSKKAPFFANVPILKIDLGQDTPSSAPFIKSQYQWQ